MLQYNFAPITKGHRELLLPSKPCVYKLYQDIVRNHKKKIKNIILEKYPRIPLCPSSTINVFVFTFEEVSP